MKKLIYLLAIIFAVSFTTTITSCGGDDPTEENGNTGNGGGSENGGSENGSGTMTPSQQKNKLENTTISFLEEFDAANFEDVVDLATYISEVYSDYDYDAIEEWGATCLESMVDFIDTWTDTEDYGSWGF